MRPRRLAAQDDYEAHLNHIKAAAKLMEEAGKTEEARNQKALQLGASQRAPSSESLSLSLRVALQVKKLRAALVKLQGSILESTRAAIACKKLRATCVWFLATALMFHICRGLSEGRRSSPC